MVSDMFEHGQQLLRNLHGRYTSVQYPEIRFELSSVLSPCGMEGMIYIPSGFIEYCLSISIPPFGNLVEPYELSSNLPQGLPALFFMWVLAHEFYHVARRHQCVLDEVGLDSEAFNATEFDADLCAVAAIFRSAQHYFGPSVDALIVKQSVLVSLYRPLRALDDPLSNNTHLNTVDRIYHILGKLAHLRANPYDPADPNCETTETKEAISALVSCLIRCEAEYANAHGTDKQEFLRKFADIARQAKWKPTVERWDELRSEVEKQSGQPA